MLLKEVLEDADLLVDNALSLDQKIRFFNQVQRAVYRDYPLSEKAYYFQTISGQVQYVLPTDCDPDYIVSLFINEKEYRYANISDENKNNLFTITNGQLFIQPTPTFIYDAYLYYKSKPLDLTVGNLAEEVPFLKDFHEIFVLGIAQKMALVGKDYKTAGELEVRFQNIAQQAMIKMGRIRLKKIRVVRGWT